MAEVRALRTLPEFEEAVRVLCAAFRAATPVDLVNTSVLVSLEMSGNYVAGAFAGDDMAGVSVGWLGAGERLHSHIVGVRPEHQGAGLGYLLKMHEREWARDRGLGVIEWTFDPLVRRNAHVNLGKLGARVVRYLEKHYGSLRDGLNDGDDTDRLLVEWDVTAPLPPPVVVTGSDRLVPTPRDIESLRDERPAEAAEWRRTVRRDLVSALAAGFEVAGFTMDGCYVLRRVSTR
ncbi:GNAT family N-acetyltransferase [Actinoplanes sp. NPDC051513]|uniref:GNAT family N-acetyltransferase n=1 Tax=Actinoplanes sp. NPDC051513 TaxID=3363908 RepID=UPI0037A6059E